ncbi:MAG: hypothetical protein QNJ65_05275 [Xenococcaceae cyanobacterium MO_234.B1]|nr:hypothetical protein [Xenococcaceae cyanobacterium MO_234.B1]
MGYFLFLKSRVLFVFRDCTLVLGLQALSKIGFVYSQQEDFYQFTWEQAVIDK